MRYSFTIYFKTNKFEKGWKESFKSFSLMKKTLLNIIDSTVETIILEDRTKSGKRYFNNINIIPYLKNFNSI